MRKNIFAIILLITLCISGCTSPDVNPQQNSQKLESQIDSEKNSETEQSQMQTETDIIEDSQSEETDSNLTETENIMYAQTTVNIRKGPGTSYESLGKLSMNDKVIALGKAVDGWQKIRYNEKTAYVYATYLSAEKKETVTPDTPPAASSGNTLPEITEAPDLTIYKPQSGGNGKLIVIDAGHQGKGNTGKEPDGPGSSVMKTKVATGTSGCVSGWHEYQLNLVVSMKLKDELLSRGYDVAMIRETHEINISNAVRAEAANKLGADAFIRVHANSSNDASIYGALTICQTANNPYNGKLYAECRKLSDCVLDGFCDATGANKEVYGKRIP